MSLKNPNASIYVQKFWTALASGTLVIGLAACEYGPVLQDQSSLSPFEEINVPFTHVWQEPSHPFTVAAVIDVNNDGRDEVFVGGGLGQKDALMTFENEVLVDRIEGSGLDDKTGATHGSVSSDFDMDGDVDLVVARDSGLFLYENENGQFSRTEIPLQLGQDATALSVSAADIENDGDMDLYVSVFVAFPAFQSATFNDPNHAKLNVLLVNQGDMTFTDQTELSATKGLQNTFHSTFVNLDGDQDLDLVLAQNTGEIEIYENNGNGTFKAHPTNSGYGFWMGLGMGDIDNDGDVDLLVSNAGTSIPAFLTTGDIRDDQKHNINWALLQNEGGFKFNDVISEKQMDGYGFAWGAVFEDLNLDGDQDALVAQNYLKWPVHNMFPLPGKTLVQSGGVFQQADGLGLDNRNYSQSPMIAELNGDGRPDVLWLNMDGPLRAYLNKSENPYLTVRLPDNMLGQGADMTLELSDGSVVKRQYIASTGLMTDMTTSVFFGMKKDVTVKSITVTPLKGEPVVLSNPDINQVIKIDLS